MDFGIDTLWVIKIGDFEINITRTIFNTWIIMLVLILLAIIVPVKLVVVFAIARLFGYHSKVSFYVGMGLVQTGARLFIVATTVLSCREA